MRRALLASALVVATTTWPSSAHANGRFPESNQIVFSEHDPDLVLLRVTFGLFVSHDRGKTFQWVCEQSIGFSGIEDPMYAVTPSKRYIGTTYQGLTLSRDQACGWSFAGGDLQNQVFIDLTSNPNDAKNVVVFASSYDTQDENGNAKFTTKIWETEDEGDTFTQLGGALDPALLGYTIDLTKTDPSRLYASAVREPGANGKGVLLTSKDRGTTWEETPVPLEGGEVSVFIAAVDPTNAERVYLRTYNPNPDKATRLILREADADGGAPTLRTVYTAGGGILGFALSPDGKKLYVGGPKDGVKIASTDDFAFTQRSNIEVQCLALAADGLWACSNERSGFVAGVSQDDGATFEPRVRFCEVAGPLGCAPGSPTNDRCNPLWPSQKALLGCGGGDPTDAGDDGGSLDAGGPPASSRGSGCDCQSSPAAGPWGALVSAIGVGAALLRRRRR